MSTAESKVISTTFHRDPDHVRKVEFVHQPPRRRICARHGRVCQRRGESTRDPQVVAGRVARRAQPRREPSVALPLFTGVSGREILRTSQVRSSRKSTQPGPSIHYQFIAFLLGWGRLYNVRRD